MARDAGLRCGLEIHQRLDTKKLFCDCASEQNEEPFAGVSRKLRPVAGELGDVDPAAMHEFMRGRHFVYRLSHGESCLVELDCEPPHGLNDEALDIALQTCILLKCTIPDEIHVMRKTVIDGSNTGGFQRTAVVGMNGSVKMPWGTVPIDQIALEEESARIESKSEHETIYRLSGLGIPLVEITTGMVDSPEKVQKIAEHIGLLLRSFNVQRGIGSIRQDVNISIAQGARVEIKGFQELGAMAELVKNEAKRQQDLLLIMQKLRKREASVDGDIKDVTGFFSDTDNRLLRDIMNSGGRIYAFVLHGFEGTMREECGDRTLGKELAGYAQAYGIGGIIHSDEDLGKYKLKNEFIEMANKFGVGRPTKKGISEEHRAERDLFVIVAGKMPEAANAAEAVRRRAAHLLTGVPEETRFSDGTGSKFARPLPGKARMYPETDVPPVIVKIPKEIPKTIFEREEKLKKQLPKELAEQMIRSHKLSLYEKLAKRHNPVLVANTLLSTLKDLGRRGYEVDKIGEDSIDKLLLLVKKGVIAKNALPDALAMVVEGRPFAEIEQRLATVSEKELRSLTRVLIKTNPKSSESAIIGMVMVRTGGRADGRLVTKIVREEMGE